MALPAVGTRRWCGTELVKNKHCFCLKPESLDGFNLQIRKFGTVPQGVVLWFCE